MKNRFATNHVIAAVALLALLPGCGVIDWIKDQMGGNRQMTALQPAMEQADMSGDGSEVVVSMDGKPLITQNRLEREKRDVVESNPQLKAMLTMMDPKQLERNLAEGLTNQEIVARYVADKGISNRAEYQEELERTMRSVKHMLNVKYFSQDFNVSVSDGDAKEFYTQNKDSMPQLLLSRGGVEAQGVEFKNKQNAEKFAAQVNASKDIEKAAQDAGYADDLKDFRLVNKQSLGIDAQLRDEILAMDSVPATKVVKAEEGGFWVVHATKKEAAQYRPFEQVKNDLKQYLEKEKRVQRFDQEISRLKDQYRVVINEDYFSPAGAPAGPNGAVAVAENNESHNDQIEQSTRRSA